jgi:hypothetical protein
MGLIDGCVSMSDKPLAAAINVPPKDRVSFDGKDISVPYDRHKRTVQRIRVSGVVRAGSVAIPAYSTEYVGGVFLLEPGGAYHGFTGSVSLEGKCSEIKTLNTRPTLFQFLEMETVCRPRSLREEFSNGQLKTSLFVGDRQFVFDPELINQHVRTVAWKEWPDILLAQMYENPEDFPPTR